MNKISNKYIIGSSGCKMSHMNILQKYNNIFNASSKKALSYSIDILRDNFTNFIFSEIVCNFMFSRLLSFIEHEINTWWTSACVCHTIC